LGPALEETMNIEQLVAIDTHVHIESDSRGNPAAEAARRYFGDTAAPANRQELA